MQKLDVAVPGTLRVVYQTCGKERCKCYSGKQQDKHGPYRYWDRKVKGKTKSISITAKQHKFIQNGIMNRKKLETFIKRILEQGARIAENIKS